MDLLLMLYCLRIYHMYNWVEMFSKEIDLNDVFLHSPKKETEMHTCVCFFFVVLEDMKR